MQKREELFRALLLAGAAGGIAMATPAFAQQAQGEDEDEAASETPTQIIVTGSRIARPDYTATSPIVTVDSDIIEQSSAVNLEANLNKLPQFSPALTQFDTADIQPNANSTPGISTVSLRQLGSNRNLVLLDGRRATPINGTGVIDINSIPSAAIQRVEIITGGASSTYGADAVGGVVNFILKDDFTGVDFDGQVSFSPDGGGEEYRLSGLVGTSLDNGRGSVLLGMEYYKREELLRQDRKAYRRARADPTVRGEEFFLSENYVSTAGSNPFDEDVLTSFFPNAPVAVPGTSAVYFNDDGSLWVNNSVTIDDVYYPLLLNYQGGTDNGLTRKILDTGLLEQNNPDRILSSPQDRYSFFAKGDYEINDWLSFVGQAYFARTETRSVSFNTVLLSSTGTEIPYDDEIYTGSPYAPETANFKISSVLPDGTPNDLTDNPTNPDFMAGGRYGLNCGPVGGCTNREVFPVPGNIATLLNSRDDPDAPWMSNYSLDAFGRRGVNTFNNTFQIQLGFEGEIPGTDFTWDVIASHGETVAKTNLVGLVSLERFRTILTSPNYGRNFFALGNNGARYGSTASCETGLSVFIPDSAFSSDCDTATSADLQFENRIAQELVEANLQGGLFELPGGQLRFALGAAYRKNSIEFTSDSSAFEGSSFYETTTTFPQASTEGSTAVRELYGELLIPVLSDMPFVEDLNLELGYRLSDYDSVGTIGTYKINGEWAPTHWLRFRGGYQKASRAPNLGELFTARTNQLSYARDGDPCSLENNTSPLLYGNYSANPDANDNGTAAQVRGLCEQMMGADAAATYYASGRDDFLLGGQYFTSLLAGANGLQEETAKTYTIGAVITSPSENPWLRRLRLSVDYYNIELTDGISQQGLDSVLRQCFTTEFNPNFEMNDACARIERDNTDGNVQVITVNYDNQGAVETSGVDVQMDWGITFEDVGIGIPGTFSTNVNFTYLDRFATTPDQVAIPLTDYAGTLGGGEVGTQSGSYRWKLFTRFNYSVGPATIALQWQHKPSIDSVAAATNETTNVAGAPAYDLFNLTGRYEITDNVTIRGGIDNLFDKSPPYVGYFTDDVIGDGTPRFGRAANPYYPSQYDVLGRRFFLAVNVKL
ncbi:Vitamin B12 transporter BtuB precursor [Croceibacterium atlanticum]|uniref:Vitamin B12 transporter BtuB n=2 Tax=Croceibacterium atlanticum TaxID=1267766 RepID=A0A0F7KUV0_9SPHN|nr:Vitamin B12 transporter BtuB precursor [Croceibacterium atlanticum]